MLKFLTRRIVFLIALMLLACCSSPATPAGAQAPADGATDPVPVPIGDQPEYNVVNVYLPGWWCSDEFGAVQSELQSPRLSYGSGQVDLTVTVTYFARTEAHRNVTGGGDWVSLTIGAPYGNTIWNYYSDECPLLTPSPSQ